MAKKILHNAAVERGRKGGSATGATKRRDGKDPEYYRRISASGVAARKTKKKASS
jgi:hypothetical protein